jgi:MFS transporter, DHA2 family, multidrug resistance protein
MTASVDGGTTPAVATDMAPVPHRRMLFFAVVVGANLQSLDTTMATVALPRMQGALSATQDEITWVLASYLIALAVVMPMIGYLANRIGRKRLFLIATMGFTIASIGAASSNSLAEMVTYRLVQGIFASPLVPLSQSFIFDAYPGDQRGRAMGWWTVGMMSGAACGPLIGGYVTEFYSWRWAFYINVPVGLLSFVLMLVFAPVRAFRDRVRPFGFVGFVILTIGLVSLQLILSRGERLDWFKADEIVIATGLVMVSFYLFAIHTATSKRPYIDVGVFQDRNFVIGLVLITIVGAQWLAFLALLSPFLQNLAGYPVITAGVAMVPQAVGFAVSGTVAGRLVGRAHPFLLMVFGVLMLVGANWQVSLLTPDFGRDLFFAIAFVHGCGLGFLFVPLTVVTFSTLPAHLTDIGTGLYALGRNFGSSIGATLAVAYLVRTTQIHHAELGTNVTPFSEALRHIPLPETWNLADASGLAALNAEATRQAVALAYINDFRWMAIVTLVAIPLILLMRYPWPSRSATAAAAQ